MLASIESDLRNDRGICTDNLIRSRKDEGILKLICFASFLWVRLSLFPHTKVQRSLSLSLSLFDEGEL